MATKAAERIEELEAEVAALKAENEGLKAENERLTAELAVATAEPPPASTTTTVYEKDGTPNVQPWVMDEGGNTHHISHPG